MRTASILAPAALASLGLLLSCESTSHSVAPRLLADRFATAEWSDPVNLGPLINSSAVEANAGVSSESRVAD
ncbi:MAG: hypothetical protein DMD46_16545 [Gemmatimonadetes bacterium]|nr:MAG: hypothetical protein DMD46_16545 [Gemmatimonadota bacterium]